MRSSTTSLIHHVRLTTTGRNRDKIAELLEDAFGAIVETRKGQFWTTTSWRYAAGVALHHGTSRKGQTDQAATAVLELPGQACELLGTAALLDLVEKIMWLLGVWCTRLDLAVDFRDGHGAHLFDALREANRNGHIVRSPHFNEHKKHDGHGRLRGQTVYVGSRESAKFTRVYDKGLEQAPLTATPGEWVRWELEAKKQGEYSNTLLMELLALHRDGGDVARGIGRRVLGSIDFRERPASDNDRHLKGRRRLPWWSKLIERMGRHITPMIPKRPTAEGARAYFLTATRNLATLAAGLGYATIEQAAQALGWDGDQADRRAGNAIDLLLTACGPPTPIALPATVRM